MSLFKRISLILLLMPFLFVVFSFVASQKAHAASYNLNLVVKEDGDGNQEYGGSTDDPCYNGTFKAEIIDDTTTNGKPRTVGPFTSQANCSGSVHTVKVTATNTYKVKLISPTNTLNYIYGYYNSNKTAIQLNKALSAGRAITMKAGDNQVAFGLATTYNLSVHYVLVDKNDNMSKDSNEECFTGEVQLYIGGVFQPWARNSNCKPGYSSPRTNLTTRVSLSLPPSSNYTIEGLKFLSDATNHEVITSRGSKSIDVTGDASVYYFIKPKVTAPTSTPTPTKKPNTTPCIPKKATIGVDKDKNGKPGQSVVWDVKITNTDQGTKCPSRTVAISKKITNNDHKAWSGSLDKNSVNLAQGEDKTVKMTITSPDWAKPDNSKKILITEKTGGLPSHSKPVRYHIVSGGNPTDSPTKVPTEKPTDKPNTPTKKPTNGPTDIISCRNKPDFLVTPDSRTADPGKTVAYTMIIKNMDERPCAARHFSLEVKMPTPNWRAVFAKETFDLEVGGQATLNVGITSPNGATPGTKDITVNLKNNAGEVVNTKTVEYCVTTCTVETSTPTPVITTQPGLTYINLAIGVDGIGTTPRIPIGGNKEPNYQNRSLNVRFIKAADNTEALLGQNNYTYNSNSEKFEGTIQLSADKLPSGIYNIYVDGPQFLTTLYPGSVTITQGAQNDLKSDNFYLITGNINNNDQSENRIDLLDYNVLISCYIYSKNKSVCGEDANYAKYSDLNDDGKVDEDDYTLFLKEYSVQQGAILP